MTDSTLHVVCSAWMCTVYYYCYLMYVASREGDVESRGRNLKTKTKCPKCKMAGRIPSWETLKWRADLAAPLVSHLFQLKSVYEMKEGDTIKITKTGGER